MIGRKQSFFEWMSTGAASFPSEQYSFWAGAISFADTSTTSVVQKRYVDNEHWALPSEIYHLETVYDAKLQTHLTPARKNILGFLKWIDVGIQIFSGTLIFGAIQNLGERLRDAFKDKVGFAADAWGFVGASIAMLGRAGLFVTQILAGAIRFPLAILSGTVGLIQGLLAKNEPKKNIAPDDLHFSKLHLVLTTIGDYVWPFAPRAARAISFYLPEKDLQALAFKHTDQADEFESRVKMSTVFRWVSMLSFAIGIILVALLATSTLGISGFATLPLIKPIAGAIAYALNHLFGWAGLQVAVQGAAAAPVLAGLVNWFSVGFFSTKAVVGVMLVGALSTFFSNAFHVFKDNVLGTDQRGRLVQRFTPESYSESYSASYSQSTASYESKDSQSLDINAHPKPQTSLKPNNLTH